MPWFTTAIMPRFMTALMPWFGVTVIPWLWTALMTRCSMLFRCRFYRFIALTI